MNILQTQLFLTCKQCFVFHTSVLREMCSAVLSTDSDPTWIISKTDVKTVLTEAIQISLKSWHSQKANATESQNNLTQKD